MEYVCVNARFLFFDGRNRYTVHYAYGLNTWYVFKDEMTENALWWKKINPSKNKSPNRIEAENILEEYLQTLTVS